MIRMIVKDLCERCPHPSKPGLERDPNRVLFDIFEVIYLDPSEALNSLRDAFLRNEFVFCLISKA